MRFINVFTARSGPPHASISGPAQLLPVIGLNLVPVAGVIVWGWHSFDIIFLYWFENLIIGAVTVARMLLRPQPGTSGFVQDLSRAAFFTVHYGMFCMGHGIFVFSLFGPSDVEGLNLLPSVIDVLSNTSMLLAAAALLLLQLLEWQRMVARLGWGAESPRTLMMRPYRRIAVLHVAIIGAGFALTALDEPMAGLLCLVAVKTGSDLWHLRREQRVALADSSAGSGSNSKSNSG